MNKAGIHLRTLQQVKYFPESGCLPCVDKEMYLGRSMCGERASNHMQVSFRAHACDAHLQLHRTS